MEEEKGGSRIHYQLNMREVGLGKRREGVGFTISCTRGRLVGGRGGREEDSLSAEHEGGWLEEEEGGRRIYYQLNTREVGWRKRREGVSKNMYVCSFKLRLQPC